VMQACEAIAEAHAAGIIHRDLKPKNLFLTHNVSGRPLIKVLDFGISKVTGADGADLGVTKTNSAVLGSPLYMAPEQMRSLRNVDARTDIWSLGVIIHEMLAGVTPFHATTLPELCASILQDPPPSLRERRSDVPEGLAQAVERCLAKDPASRFADVAALAEALAPFGTNAGKASAERIVGVFRAHQPERVVVESNPPRPLVSALAQTDVIPASAVDPIGATRALASTDGPVAAKSSPPPKDSPATSEPPGVGASTTGKASWSTPEERGPSPMSGAERDTGERVRPRTKRRFPLVFGLAVAVGAAALIFGLTRHDEHVVAREVDAAAVIVNAVAPPATTLAPAPSTTEPTVLTPMPDTSAKRAFPTPPPLDIPRPVVSLVVPVPSVNVPVIKVPVVPPRPPAANCANPHFYDDAGVQRWKIECLAQ